MRGIANVKSFWLGLFSVKIVFLKWKSMKMGQALAEAKTKRFQRLAVDSALSP